MKAVKLVVLLVGMMVILVELAQGAPGSAIATSVIGIGLIYLLVGMTRKP